MKVNTSTEGIYYGSRCDLFQMCILCPWLNLDLIFSLPQLIALNSHPVYYSLHFLMFRFT